MQVTWQLTAGIMIFLTVVAFPVMIDREQNKLREKKRKANEDDSERMKFHREIYEERLRIREQLKKELASKKE
jgi:hypothetical protein